MSDENTHAPIDFSSIPDNANDSCDQKPFPQPSHRKLTIELTDEDAGEEADSSATRVSADKYFDRNAVPLTSDKDNTTMDKAHRGTMSGNSPPDYKALFLKADEERKRAEERQRLAEERAKQERERNRPTTFPEFIQHCHDLLWKPLRVQIPSRSTTGKIPSPTGKCCPMRFLPWTDCEARQRELYESVCRYLQPIEEDSQQLFTPLNALEDHGRRFARRPISSEKDLETYERFAVEDHVQDIVAELCKIPGAREEFRLGSGISFDNHANALDEDDEIDAGQSSSTKHSKPDQFCINRVDRATTTLLATVEYKPPHKLPVAILHQGLRPMDFWREIVKPDTVPMEEPEKAKYNAARLVGSAIVQEFHVMVQEGLAYSYLTNGLVDVQLWVPEDDPTTLYYNLGDPRAGVGRPEAPMTRIERTLCLCLMSFRTPLRDQAWRNAADSKLPKWHTSFDSERSQIPTAALLQNLDVDYASSEYNSPERTTSEYLPSSSPGSPVAEGRRVPTRAAPGCAPSSDQHVRESSFDSEVDPAASAGRKRKVSSSIPTRRSTREKRPRGNQSGQSRSHVAEYCTQRCLLGLQQGGILDPDCPNVELHMLSGSKDGHPISAADLVTKLKGQLDQDLDHNCTPVGPCGSYGAPFKITCSTFGYTIFGKGTNSRLWGEVSREAEVYQVLQRAQGLAVPVFLGAINLAQIYFFHGAGKIRHMLLMGWGGISMNHMTLDKTIQRAISHSVKEIRSLGISHQDLRLENILWNTELKRALIIDFHRCTLDHRPMHKRPGSLKRLRPEERESKELCGVR